MYQFVRTVRLHRAAVPFALLASLVSPALAETLGKVAVIGDSLSAGFQNGMLLYCQQQNGYANLVVNQALSSRPKAASSPLVLPLAQSVFYAGSPLPLRINVLQQATDLAVPGQT